MAFFYIVASWVFVSPSSSLVRAFALIGEGDDSTGIGRRGFQLERGVEVVGQNPLPTADAEWVEQEVQLVHQVVLQHKVHQLLTAIRRDGLAGGCFQLAN